MFTETRTKGLTTHVYPSLDAFADYQTGLRGYTREVTKKFTGVESVAEAIDRAKTGIPDTGVKVLNASKALVKTSMQQVNAIDMVSTFDTSGAYVDMGRYVTGEPECMVEHVINVTPVTKPVVKVVMNIAASGGVDKRELEKRGRLVVALVKAIEMSGRSTELWADFTSSDTWTNAKNHIRIAVKLRGAGAALDMGAVMYAFSDPSMLRALIFNAMHAFPQELHAQFSIGGCYAYPTKGAVRVTETYGKDAVYLESARLGDDPEATVTRVLTELGIA